MTPLDLDLDRLEELAKKATPGPWSADGIPTEDGHGKYETSEITIENGSRYYNTVAEFSNSTVGPIERDSEGYRWDEGARCNSALIVSAINALPTLIAEARQVAGLREERDKLIAAVSEHVTVRGQYFARAEVAEREAATLREGLHRIAWIIKAVDMRDCREMQEPARSLVPETEPKS